MKQFFSLMLVAVTLLLSDPGEAYVATRRECRLACDQSVHSCAQCNEFWGSRWVRCYHRLKRGCRRYGTSGSSMDNATVTPTTMPSVTTTTVPAPFRVDRVDQVLCDGTPAQKIWITYCARTLLANMSPLNFELTQGGLTYEYSACQYARQTGPMC